MLFWHLGLKRTGTTSLQTALVIHQARLAEAGLIYPHHWRTDDLAGYSTHHGLQAVIESSDPDAPARRRFRDYLATRADKSILLSSEFISDWLTVDWKRKRVHSALLLAQSIMPVTCMLTLRRLDEAVNSLSLRRALLGIDLIRPRLWDVAQLAESFVAELVGMRGLDDVLGERVRYVKYAPDGSHNREILQIVNLPIDVRQVVEAALAGGLRLNRQMTRKGATALLHCGVLSERCGVRISPTDLQRALFLGEFNFEEDEPCELLGEEVRRALHTKTLLAAREHGMGEYVEFFAGAEVSSGPPTTFDPAILRDDDLEQLLTYLRSLQDRDLNSAIRPGYEGQ